MFYAAWTILFLLGAAYLLSFIGLRALYFERRTRALRAEVGSYFDERIIVENRRGSRSSGSRSRIWASTPSTPASFVVSLGPYGRFVRRSTRSAASVASFSSGRLRRERRPVRAVSPAPRNRWASTLVVYPVRCRWRRSAGSMAS